MFPELVSSCFLDDGREDSSHKNINIATTTMLYAQLLSCVQLFATLWTVAHQAPLSMEFPRQACLSGLPFPPPSDLPNLGIEPMFPALAGGFFTTDPLRKPHYHQHQHHQKPSLTFTKKVVFFFFFFWLKECPSTPVNKSIKITFSFRSVTSLKKAFFPLSFSCSLSWEDAWVQDISCLPL